MAKFSDDVRDFFKEEDKQLHIVVSMVLTLIILVIFMAFGIECLSVMPYVIGLSIGIGKEVLWDLAMNRGTPSMRDIYADVIGVSVAYGIIHVLNFVYHFL